MRKRPGQAVKDILWALRTVRLDDPEEGGPDIEFVAGGPRAVLYEIEIALLNAGYEQRKPIPESAINNARGRKGKP